MFCLRGLYQADIVTMHKYANNPDINDSEAGWDKRRFIKHERSKSGELMKIKINISYSQSYSNTCFISRTNG